MKELMKSVWTGQVTEKYSILHCSVTASFLLNLQPLLCRASFTCSLTINFYVPLVLSVLFSPRDPCLGIQARLLKEHKSTRDKNTLHRFYAHFFRMQKNLATVIGIFTVKEISKVFFWVMTGHGCTAFYAKKISMHSSLVCVKWTLKEIVYFFTFFLVTLRKEKKNPQNHLPLLLSNKKFYVL